MMPRPYCVIGDPIAHSLSPPIHTAVFRYLGLADEYTAVHVKSEALSGFVEDARQNRRPGFNVTIPHKEAIMPLLDRIDPPARNMGAVNTVHLERDLLIGFNTDVLGCMTALKREGFSSRGRAVIIGAGGAARAGLEAVARLGMTGCAVYDIDPHKADALIQHFKPIHTLSLESVKSDTSRLHARIREAELIINASPAGMWPDADGSPLPDPSCIQEHAWVFDMVYSPRITRLLADAAEAGATPVSGLSMLVAQAIEADAIFLNRPLPSELLDHVLPIAESVLEKKRMGS